MTSRHHGTATEKAKFLCVEQSALSTFFSWKNLSEPPRSQMAFSKLRYKYLVVDLLCLAAVSVAGVSICPAHANQDFDLSALDSPRGKKRQDLLLPKPRDTGPDQNSDKRDAKLRERIAQLKDVLQQEATGREFRTNLWGKGEVELLEKSQKYNKRLKQLYGAAAGLTIGSLASLSIFAKLPDPNPFAAISLASLLASVPVWAVSKAVSKKKKAAIQSIYLAEEQKMRGVLQQSSSPLPHKSLEPGGAAPADFAPPLSQLPPSAS